MKRFVPHVFRRKFALTDYDHRLTCTLMLFRLPHELGTRFASHSHNGRIWRDNTKWRQRLERAQLHSLIEIIRWRYSFAGRIVTAWRWATRPVRHRFYMLKDWMREDDEYEP